MTQMNATQEHAGDSRAPVVALTDDLYFMAIINSAARAHGVPVVFLRSGQAIRLDAPLVLVDLDGLHDWEEQIAQYIAAGGEAAAFGPHLDTERRKRAKAVGCRRVLAKSKFVREVGPLLAWVKTHYAVLHYERAGPHRSTRGVS
jgi:hypothetical protein